MSILIFLIPFFTYLITLSPSIHAGDSGELISSGYALGIPHPPGYPLYCIISKILTVLIPFGNIAYRINLMSAIFASITTLLLYTLLKKLQITNYKLQIFKFEICNFEFVITLCFAFSRTFWCEAVEGEVYTLNMFFVVIVLYFVFFYKLFTTYSLLLAFLFGLSLSHHHSMILFTPLVELSLIKNLKPKNFKFYFLTFVFLLFPLFLYLYLPIRSLSNPLIDWGNAKDYTNVFYHILRKQYGSLSKLQRSFPLFLAQMKVFLKFVYTQFHPLLLIFIPFGIIALKRKINIFLFITLYLILSVGVILLLNFNITDELIEVVEVFFIPSHLILIIFIFFGVNLVFEKVKKIFLFLFFLFPIVIFTSNFFYSNRSRNFLAYDYGMNIISSINEKNAILFTKGDNQIFPLVYLFSVEEKGKELKIYDDYNFIFKGLYGENFNKLPEEEQNSKRYEIIRKVMNSTKLQIYYTAAAHISLFPEVKAISNGIIYKLMKEDSSYDMDQIIWRKYILREENFYKTYLSSNISAQYHYFLGKYYLRKKFLENAIHEFEKATLTGYAMESMYNNVAAEYFDMKEYDKALSLLKKAMSINPNKPEIYWNIGTVYLTKNDFDNAILYYEKAIKIKPTYADAYAKLGETYFRKKNIERAIFYTKKALEYNPTHQEAKENLKKFIKQ